MEKELFDKLFTAASQARENSYSPISHFKVGAAFITKEGNIYAGTNIEEAAFNSCTHAEQAAIAQMVSKEGRKEITQLVVVAGNDGDGTIAAPCGHCRQILLEFAQDGLEIISAGPKGDIRLETTLGELMPYAFRLGNFM